MREKKERGRFTIKLNENDPAHERAIRLLESQRPHSKAQFVVDALLHYTKNHAAAKGREPAIERAAIEAIVRDILKSSGQDLSAGKIPDRPSPPETSTDSDGQAFSLISDTLSAFRGG